MTYPVRTKGRRAHPGKVDALNLARDPNMTLSMIAERVGASVSAVSRWVEAERNNPAPTSNDGKHGAGLTNSEELPIMDGSSGTSAAVSGETTEVA